MRTAIRDTIRALPGGPRLIGLYRQYRLAPRKAHRGYVGGMWEAIGKVQFDFMLSQGLREDDVLLDIACGSLRGGRHFIEYLAPEHYLGLDQHAWLIESGLRMELPKQTRAAKRPEFVVSDGFEFHLFSKRPTIALANSLLSHLVTDDIRLCLSNLRSVMEPEARFYASYIRTGTIWDDYENPAKSDAQQAFQYEPEAILAIGRETGWRGRDLGEWGHPRGQQMIEFIAGAAVDGVGGQPG